MTTRRLLFCLALLLTPAALPADEAKGAAERAVERLKGRIVRDDKAPGKPVVAVDLSFRAVTDADLKHLAGLKDLRELDLDGQGQDTGQGQGHRRGVALSMGRGLGPSQSTTPRHKASRTRHTPIDNATP
jgi:hypothetical protein